MALWVGDGGTGGMALVDWIGDESGWPELWFGSLVYCDPVIQVGTPAAAATPHAERFKSKVLA